MVNRKEKDPEQQFVILAQLREEIKFFMYLRRSLWLFRNPPWFHKSCVFLYYIPLQWARRPIGARGWAADEGPWSNWPVLPVLCKPSRPALPLTLLVYGGDGGAQAQLNLRSSQPKSLPQYLYSNKKMVFCGNFPQPDIFSYCRFSVICPLPRPSGNPDTHQSSEDLPAGPVRQGILPAARPALCYNR